MRFKSILLCSVLLLATVLLVFSQVRNHKFVLLDDNIHLQENKLVLSPSLEGAGKFWQAPFLGLYIPVTYSFWVWVSSLDPTPHPDGLRPRNFHLMSLLLHLLNTLGVFFLLRRLTHQDWGSCIGALFFALHPLQSESVAWISAQKDLLGTFFALSSTYAFLTFIESLRWPAGILSLFLLLLSLLSKPMGVLHGLLFLVMAVQFKVHRNRKVLAVIGIALMMAIPVMIVTKMVQPNDQIPLAIQWWQRPIIALDTIAFYVSKLALPFNLAPDYSRNPVMLIHHWTAWISWLIPALCGYFLWKRGKNTLLPLAFFFIPLIPVLGLVPFYFQIFSTVADRYTYFSLFGIALLIAQTFRFHRIQLIFTSLVLVGMGFLTWRQVGQWKDNIHLFTHTLIINPSSILAHNNLGAELEKYNLFSQSLYHYQESSRLAPKSIPPIYNQARILALQGKLGESKKMFIKVLGMNPHIAEALHSLAMISIQEKKEPEAEAHFLHALKMKPDLVIAHFQFAKMLEGQKRMPEALSHYQLALRFQPNYAPAKEALTRLKGPS